MQCGSSPNLGLFDAVITVPPDVSRCSNAAAALGQVLHQDVVVRALEIYQDQRSKILMLEQDKNKGQYDKSHNWRWVFGSANLT